MDILWAGQQRNENPACEVPHPRLTQRRFALQPLLDLVPDAIDPLTGCRYVESLPAVADQQISLVSSFVDYPQRDYCVGGVAAARALNPEVGSREALRQLGQLEFPTVAGSTLGRVMLAGVVDILVV